MDKVVLECHGLSKRYGNLLAIDDLSMTVYEGEVFGFLGPNGAGKTTTINILCGLLQSDSGEVLFHGAPIAASANQRARIGVCPQNIIIWERLTCLEQMVFIGQMYGIERRAAKRRSLGLLEDLGLAEKAHQQGRTLSGGMKRRLNLALALVHDPELLVLDEPEAGLDPQSRVRVREYVQTLAQQKTIILTTHNMDEAERLAHRVAIIDRGRLLVCDRPQALKDRLGAGDVLEINLAGSIFDQPQMETELRQLDEHMQVNFFEDRLVIRALNLASLLPQILLALEEAGIQPDEVRLRPNTLEDVFIQLTGRNLRE